MRILFITATRIGDSVLSSGLLHHLISQNPGARVTIAAGQVSAPLFAAVPGLERLIEIDKRPLKLHWLDLWRAAVGRRWDLVVDLRSSAIAYGLWAGQRLVTGRRCAERHRVVELADLLAVQPPPAPTVWLAPQNEAEAARLIADGGPVLALAPAANWPGKEWPPDRFAEFARRLTAPGARMAGARVAILAAAHERARIQTVVDAVPQERRIDLVGAVDLLTAAACLQRCALFVGNDSGLMHLAAAAGVPTLGLFGPSPENRYHPWGAHTAFVRTRESSEDLLARFAATRDAARDLMDGLAVETVVAAAEELWCRAGAG